MSAGLKPAQEEVLEQLLRAWPERRMVLIGAAALGMHLEMTWRETFDVDLTLIADAPTVAETMLPNFTPNAWYQIGDIYFLAQRTYDAPQGRVHADYTIIRGPVVDRRTASYRVYALRELCKLCELAGFGDITAHGGIEETPYALGSPRLILVCKKR